MYWRLCATVVAMMAAAGGIATPAPNHADPSILVPVYVHDRRPLVMLTVGGKVPSPIIFDTGTDENIVSQTFADQYALERIGRSPLIDLGTGKSAIVPTVALPDPKLGGVPISVKTAQVLARNVPDEVGIFGPYSFSDYLVVLEGSHNRIRLVPRDAGLSLRGPAIPYDKNLPSIPITIGDKTVKAHLDSGNSADLVLGEGMMGTVPMTGPATVVGVAISALGEKEVYGGQLTQTVRVGPITLNQPEVTFSGRGTGANVGFPVIRQLTVVLDPKLKKSWILDPATEQTAMADFAGRFGPRELSVENGVLYHQREGRPKFALRYLGGDLFEMTATGDRIQFFRRGSAVNRLELLTTEGDVVPTDRSD